MCEPVGRLPGAIDIGTLAHAHRAVLIDLVARMRPDSLAAVADAPEAIDGTSVGLPLASVLADLARTRQHMLDELGRRRQPEQCAPSLWRPATASATLRA